jgi:hypothetical protein
MQRLSLLPLQGAALKRSTFGEHCCGNESGTYRVKMIWNAANPFESVVM